MMITLSFSEISISTTDCNTLIFYVVWIYCPALEKKWKPHGVYHTHVCSCSEAVQVPPGVWDLANLAAVSSLMLCHPYPVIATEEPVCASLWAGTFFHLQH